VARIRYRPRSIEKKRKGGAVGTRFAQRFQRRKRGGKVLCPDARSDYEEGQEMFPSPEKRGEGEDAIIARVPAKIEGGEKKRGRTILRPLHLRGHILRERGRKEKKKGDISYILH